MPRVVEDKEALRQDHGDKLQATQLSDLREKSLFDKIVKMVWYLTKYQLIQQAGDWGHG